MVKWIDAVVNRGDITSTSVLKVQKILSANPSNSNTVVLNGQMFFLPCIKNHHAVSHISIMLFFYRRNWCLYKKMLTSVLVASLLACVSATFYKGKMS